MRIKEPREYIDKNTTFLNRKYYIDNRVHIPRPSTEFITRYYIDNIIKYPKDITIAEIGTGSGVISISLALGCTNISKIYAVDLYNEALDVALINIGKYKLKKKIELIQGDLFTPVQEKMIDIVIANLPFASDQKMRDLRPEVLFYEPICGIYGGKTGFELYERLFFQLKDYKYINSLKGIWIYTYNEHFEKLNEIKDVLFKDYSIKTVKDPNKPNYLNCYIYRNLI